MKLHHAIALAVLGWYLMLPAQPDDRGVADAAPSTPAAAMTFAVYQTQQACEEDHRQQLNDPVIGERMAAAKCLPTNDEPKK
jgi:hypothetical protein